MSNTLLPCPFCGKRVALIDNCHELEDCENFERCEDTGYYAVVCSVNEGGCGASGGYARTEQEAVTKWNRRADVVPVVRGEWIEAKLNGMSLYPVGQKMCSICGQIMPSRWKTMPPFCYGCGALMDGGEKHEAD